MFEIYRITIPTSKGPLFYIGQHKLSEGKYFDENYLGSGNVIKNWLKHHRAADLVKEQLFTFDQEKDIKIYEKLFIKLEKIVKEERCVNFAEGGEGGNTLQYATIETIIERGKKISASNTSRKASEETRKKIALGNTGKIISDAAKRNISKALRGVPKSAESNKKRSVSLTGHRAWNKGKKGFQKGPMLGKFLTAEQKRKEALNNGRSIPIRAINQNDDKELYFYSGSEAANFFGIGRHYVYTKYALGKTRPNPRNPRFFQLLGSWIFSVCSKDEVLKHRPDIVEELKNLSLA
jgi:hypothetical protein